MKRIVILVSLGLLLCSTAAAFQSGGGESTKKASTKKKVVTKNKPSGTKSAKTTSQRLSTIDLVLAKFFNSNGFVHSVTFSPNEKLLAVDGSNGQGKGEVNIYDIMTGEKLKSFDVYGYTRSIAFSPDGNLFAIAADDVGTVIYNSNTGKPIKSLKGKTNVNRISFSKDGNYLGVAALYEAYIYDVKTFEQLVFFKTKSHDSQISFDPNGKSFLIANSEGIFTYDLPTGNLLNSSTPTWRLVNSASLSPNGKFWQLEPWIARYYMISRRISPPSCMTGLPIV
jgi:WD40 repeat protein